MGFCSENQSVSIGCKEFCSSIDLGYDAIQDGNHFIEVYVSNGVYNSIDLGSLSIGDDLIVPSGELNESKEQYLRVKQPDNSYYEFETDKHCIRLHTYII